MNQKENKERVHQHKYGANRNELAMKKKKLDSNFSQSKDIWEDRSVRQRTFNHKRG
ncbi:MAG: hypothetical protein HQM15_09780 [Deltaproteobacteria bacterium]|nr:hypothetical protein [Deltaproteobacteria bacterium]